MTSGGAPPPVVRVVAADWSGARAPVGGLAIAAVEADATGALRVDVALPRSREEAVARLVAEVRNGTGAIGLDFAFSFPAWFIRREKCTTAEDFWLRVAARAEEWLADRPAPFSRTQLGAAAARDAEATGRPLFRPTEHAVAGARVSPKSVFQIGGSGQVGMASLRGIPYLPILRAAGAAVWPFDRAATGQCAVVEIYPRVLYGDDVVKAREEDRTRYLAAHRAHLDEAAWALIGRSDHAFDAVASALAMWDGRASLADLPTARDATERLEGRIWSKDLLATGSA